MKNKEIKKLESAACKLRVKLVLAEENIKNKKSSEDDIRLKGALGYVFEGEYAGC